MEKKCRIAPKWSCERRPIEAEEIELIKWRTGY